MTSNAQQVVASFESLPDSEKREVLAVLLRRTDFPSLPDEELVAAADAVFLEYDRREAGE